MNDDTSKYTKMNEYEIRVVFIDMYLDMMMKYDGMIEVGTVDDNVIGIKRMRNMRNIRHPSSEMSKMGLNTRGERKLMKI